MAPPRKYNTYDELIESKRKNATASYYKKKEKNRELNERKKILRDALKNPDMVNLMYNAIRIKIENKIEDPIEIPSELSSEQKEL